MTGEVPSGIFSRDNQAGIEQAWHGQTKVVETVTENDAFPYELERVKFNTETGSNMVRESLATFMDLTKRIQTGEKVSKKSVSDAEKNAKKALEMLEKSKIPGFSCFIANDDQALCGKPVMDSYTNLSNKEFWNVCKDALSGTGAIVESAGTIMDRSRRFMTIKLADDQTQIGGRTFKHRISLIDSIDGSTYFYGVNTSICVVCVNTSVAAIGDMTGQFRFKFRHSKGLKAKIEGMEMTIESMLGVRAQFNEALQIAASEQLVETNARNLFAGWIGGAMKEDRNSIADELSTRAINTVDRLVELYRGEGKGNKGETLLDGISAVTDFYSHESSGGMEKEGFRWKQYNSSEFGAGARAKTDFISSLFETKSGKLMGLNRPAIATMQDVGSKLLAMS